MTRTARVLARAGAALAATAALTRLGWPALALTLALALAVVAIAAGVLCWVLASEARSARAARLLAARNTAPPPASELPAAEPPAVTAGIRRTG
jgi:hypothetical protein